MIIRFYKNLLIVLFILSTFLISSCREDEQNRVLNYNKGVNLGEKDTQLTEQQITKLRIHTSRQKSN